MKDNLFLGFKILLLVTMTSCSSYIARMHSSIDREMARQEGRKAPDHFDQFRSQPQNIAPIKPNPVPSLSFKQQPNVLPATQRQYRPTQENTRRITANDLNDNSSNGSLWVNNGSQNNLYTSNKTHGHGDIILVDVYRKLRNEITLELQRAFPPAPSDSSSNSPEEQAAQANENATDDQKVYDRISTVIVEQINQDHVLLRGRKYLIFRSIRRLVEVQALISRRDITDSDSVSSDSILESRISVLR